MISRRQFFKASLAGGATALIGQDLQAVNSPVNNSFQLQEDIVPRAKGNRDWVFVAKR